MILKAQNIVKKFNTNKPVNNVSLNIKKGQFISIIGQSGSGKTTLLNILSGIEKPDSGTVIINKQDIYNQKEDEIIIYRRKNIGIIYQFYNLIPSLTVKENIVLPLELSKEKIDWDYFYKLVRMLKIKDKINNLPNNLSGGQMQRVAIARALIAHPQIILADEPTGNLDSKNSKKVIELLKKINKEENITIILVTHDPLVAKQADRMIEYQDGKIIKDVKISKNKQ